MEHRWSSRHCQEGEVTAHCPPVGSFRAAVRDISLGGMFIETGETELRLHAPVSVSLVLRDRGEMSSHRLHAMVVRTTAAGAGLMYLDSSAETLQPLRRWLATPHAPPPTRRRAAPWAGVDACGSSSGRGNHHATASADHLS